MKLHDIFNSVYLLFAEHLSHLFRRLNYTCSRELVSLEKKDDEETRTKLSEKVGLFSDTSEKSSRLSGEHILARVNDDSNPTTCISDIGRDLGS